MSFCEMLSQFILEREVVTKGVMCEKGNYNCWELPSDQIGLKLSIIVVPLL